MKKRKYEVRSSGDGLVAFTAESVEREAKLWRTTPLEAARKIARENGDEVMGERLYVVQADQLITEG